MSQQKATGVTAAAPAVLCVDDDRDIAEVVQAILADEGYRVSCVYDISDDALMRAVGRVEPDMILLDSASASDYSDAWNLAATLHHRFRPVPVVMFTGHSKAVREAKEGESKRSEKASFAGILEKPFNLDELLETVSAAVGQSTPFDRSSAGEKERTRSLIAALKARGATDVRPSKMREWATFRDRDGRLSQIYWWQMRGVYQVGRYRDSGEMDMVGQFIGRDTALEMALPEPPENA